MNTLDSQRSRATEDLKLLPTSVLEKLARQLREESNILLAQLDSEEDRVNFNLTYNTIVTQSLQTTTQFVSKVPNPNTTSLKPQEPNPHISQVDHLLVIKHENGV